MSTNPQIDVHPDAESLNAFAEQALGERDRGQILAHLAGCGQCRQVVYLAQKAAAEIEPAGVVAVRRESWFRDWRLAWVPAAALGAVVATAYVVHLRRAETVPEAMRVASGDAAKNEDLAARLQATRAATAAVPRPVPAVPAKVFQKTLKPKLPAFSAAPAFAGGADEAADRSVGQGPLLPIAGASSSDAVAELGAATKQKEAGRSNAALQFRTLPIQTLPLQSFAKKTSQVKTTKTTGLQSPTGVLASGAPMPLFNAKPAPPESLKAKELHGALTMYKSRLTGLPTGLPVVSTVTLQRAPWAHSTLAVDPGGSVFLSEDSGVHWEAVASQWSGRAVVVRLQAAPGSAAGEGTLAVGTFEIVNDKGKVWVSTDGRTWKAK